eukprot:TRINITY_DN1187_c0_g1_i3.p2 TRINITY_DN1187_c0_g1~~TRINITY_DN1187_c0_g1_i3.p2  ORF type:complete len:274 (-),score=52.11 TRINITY_DN1187_c0_g1_i3:990-1721(-)
MVMETYDATVVEIEDKKRLVHRESLFETTWGRFFIYLIVLALSMGCYTAIYGVTLPVDHMNNMSVLLVNNDQPFDCTAPHVCTGSPQLDPVALALFNGMGEQLVQTIKNTPVVKDFVDWEYTSDVSFEEAEQMVNDGKYWFVLFVAEDYSAQHLKAFNTIDKTKYSNPVQFIYDCGRNYHLTTIYTDAVKTIFNNINDGAGDRLEANPQFAGCKWNSYDWGFFVSFYSITNVFFLFSFSIYQA